MSSRWIQCLSPFASALAILVSVCSLSANAPAAEKIDYEQDIKPLLSAKCYACHGALKQESDLRLDTAALAKQGGFSGPAIVPHKPAESFILQRVLGADDAELMPPEGEGEKLTTEQVALLRTWIEQGAIAPEETATPDPRLHWAYQLPEKADIPQPANSTWVRNPIDAFIASSHEQQGLSPAPAAQKHILLRRVYLDLIGLPPTREELTAFEENESPEAYEKVVDQLLASPRYGERWGRHWMDVWRYSDWSGFNQQIRNSQRHIWHWRDWIIESLNEDKPYDRMIVEMLAGDEIAPTDPKTLRATGFLARSWFKFNRNTWLESTVEHTSKAFLGMTINCAKCHDHKYDPLTQKEFYQFRAFFEPYDVRTDRLPGEPDPLKGGLPRVYDAKADTPTYLFLRGSEIAPDKEHPLPPVPPKALGGELQINPVKLPVASYYPFLNDFVVKESVASAKAEITKANEALAAARTEEARAKKALADFIKSLAEHDQGQASQATSLEKDKSKETSKTSADLEQLLEGNDKKPAHEKPAKPESLKEEQQKDQPKKDEPAPTVDDLKLAVKSAAQLVELREEELLAALVGLQSIKARTAADQAKHADPLPDNAEELYQTASKLEREFILQQAKVTLLTAEQALSTAQQMQPTDDAKSKAAVTKAQGEVEVAQKKLSSAEAALTMESTGYSALGSSYPRESTGRRSALARWIANNKNPLTARVAVNHIWLRHIGSPLVDNMFDFGLRSPQPRHAELLDWLAVEFMEHGWSMKHLHRLIVTSNLYRMTSSPSATDEANLTKDQDNHFLWRMNSRRLEAEAVRDSVLFVAGNLDLTLGGPDVDHKQGLTTARRSVYYRHAYEKQMKFLELFDAASVNECYRRSESIVPQQALALANSTLALDQARLLARSINKLAYESMDPEERFVYLAYRQMLSRSPTISELGFCSNFLQSQTRLLSDKTELTNFVGGQNATVKPAEDPALRARENLIHVLLNHNDFVTIR